MENLLVRPRGVGEVDVLEGDAALDLFRAQTLLGQRVNQRLALDDLLVGGKEEGRRRRRSQRKARGGWLKSCAPLSDLENLISGTAAGGHGSQVGRRLADGHTAGHDGEQNNHDIAGRHLALFEQLRAVPVAQCLCEAAPGEV